MELHRDESPLHLVRSALGEGIVVGIDAFRVASIEDQSELDPETRTAALDLGAHLDLPQVHRTEERRVLHVIGRRLRRPIIVGEQVRIEKIAPTAIHPLPTFLGALDKLVGLKGVFQLESDLGWVLDVEWMVTHRAVGGGT